MLSILSDYSNYPLDTPEPNVGFLAYLILLTGLPPAIFTYESQHQENNKIVLYFRLSLSNAQEY